MKNRNYKKKKSNIRLGKETYGTMPIEECFRKALDPYFPGIAVVKRKVNRK